MSGARGSAGHCSICGATNRNRVTHIEGMTRAEHELGAVDNTRPPLTADERLSHLDKRESWEGRMVTMPDNTRWKVLKHINGSLYQLTSNGKFRFASHPTETSEWQWWEDRPGSRTAAERVQTEDEQDNTPSMTRQEAMSAMDEAVEDLVAQEDEAATMAPPTEDSDTVRLEVLGARLEQEDGQMFVVFKVGPDYYSGRLDKYVPVEFDPLDLIRKREDD